jgi:hypothetical protein
LVASRVIVVLEVDGFEKGIGDCSAKRAVLSWVVSQSWTSGVSREVVGGAAARKIAVAMRGRERRERGRMEPPDAGYFRWIRGALPICFWEWVESNEGGV